MIVICELSSRQIYSLSLSLARSISLVRLALPARGLASFRAGSVETEIETDGQTEANTTPLRDGLFNFVAPAAANSRLAENSPWAPRASWASQWLSSANKRASSRLDCSARAGRRRRCRRIDWIVGPLCFCTQTRARPTILGATKVNLCVGRLH